MKCLEITFIPPDQSSGGGLGIFQSISSLLSVCDVDYIGPDFDEDLFCQSAHKLNALHILKNERRGIKAVYDLIVKGISTGFYRSWVQICSGINWDKYDIVHVESTRYHFAVQQARKYRKIVFVRVHNIEKDYGMRIFFHKRNFLNLVRMYSFARNERKSVHESDRLIFLTRKDVNRAISLYHVKKEQIEIVPVCIDRKPVSQSPDKKRKAVKNLLITGTLSYGANADGIMWFLLKVWRDLYKKNIVRDCSLTIAGSDPDQSLIQAASEYTNVKIAASPNDMMPYFINADLYLAPIFDGAGMKVKVAEALSYGISVIGTSHAWTGYENVTAGKYIADNAQTFKDLIEKAVSQSMILPAKSEVVDMFDTCIGMCHSCDRYHEMIRKALI